MYKVIELTGIGAVPWEEAARTAVLTVSKSLRDLRAAEINELDLKVENEKVVALRCHVLESPDRPWPLLAAGSSADGSLCIFSESSRARNPAVPIVSCHHVRMFLRTKLAERIA